MLHEYRKKTTIKAEQFDGSDEMAEKAADNQNDWLYQLVHDENNWELYGGNNEL